MDYLERMKWYRVENYLLVFWADALIARDLLREELIGARLGYFHGRPGCTKERVEELRKASREQDVWTVGLEAACREVRALRIGDGSTLRPAEVKRPTYLSPIGYRRR